MDITTHGFYEIFPVLLVAKSARSKKSLVTLTEVARCKKSLVARCKIRSLLIAYSH